MKFEQVFTPGGESDTEEAQVNVNRQLESVRSKEKREMSDEEVRQYILDHIDMFDQRKQILRLIELQAMTQTVPGLKEHIEKHLVPKCIHYTETVAEFDQWAREFASGTMTAEEFERKGQSRSRTHDAMIADFNVVIRGAREAMGDQPWMDQLNNRSDYAKLALQIAAEKMLAN